MAKLESSQETVQARRYRPSRETQSSSLADILERVLDKGIVITGDIKIFLTDVELLTIQVRLIICSVEKAEEIGLDWWKTNPAFSSKAGAVSREVAERAEEPQPSKV